MKPQFVLLLCDVTCYWEGEPPRYRLFVNEEMFTERTFIWPDHYLEENIQIMAPPGKYSIRFELLDPERASIRVKNYRVAEGRAREFKGTLEIFDENK